MEAATLRQSFLTRRPDPSLLAFVASLVVLGAFTRLRLMTPYGASDQVLAEFERVVSVAVAATALIHALVAALAARARRPLAGVALLLLATSVLPHLLVLARAPLSALLHHVAPSFCAYDPEYCPPDGWPPIAGLLVGVLLAPIVVTAIRVRGDDALDAPARMLWITGVWVGIVTTGLHVARVATPGPTLFAWTVAGACMLLATLDTLRRASRLRALLRTGRAIVTEARDDDPGDLRFYASVPGLWLHDRVLRFADGHAHGPYRSARRDEALARVPGDAGEVQRVLDARLRGQALAVLAATVAFALTTR